MFFYHQVIYSAENTPEKQVDIFFQLLIFRITMFPYSSFFPASQLQSHHFPLYFVQLILSDIVHFTAQMSVSASFENSTWALAQSEQQSDLSRPAVLQQAFCLSCCYFLSQQEQQLGLDSSFQWNCRLLWRLSVSRV